MRSAIILDKSFLDGAPTQTIHELCRDYNVMCSETLFFELMTTRPESQIRCFSKFPPSPGSFSLLPDLAPLLRAELESGAPCGDVSNYVIADSFIFNERLALGTYQPPMEVREHIRTWQREVESEARAFLERCQVVHEFFPELIGIEFREFPAAVSAAKLRVATDVSVTREILASFDHEVAPPGMPPADQLDASWAWFRWLQCQLIAALRLFERYQCKVPTDPTPGVLERAEHSLHDVRYVVLGTLAGAIATNDKEIIEDISLVAPHVQIIRPVLRAA